MIKNKLCFLVAVFGVLFSILKPGNSFTYLNAIFFFCTLDIAGIYDDYGGNFCNIDEAMSKGLEGTC